MNTERKKRNHPEIEICVRICRTPKYYVAISYTSLAKVFLFICDTTIETNPNHFVYKVPDTKPNIVADFVSTSNE